MMTASTNNSAFSDPFDIAIIESEQVVEVHPDLIRVTERVSGGHVLVHAFTLWHNRGTRGESHARAVVWPQESPLCL
jgi:hypothetical protein